MTDPPGHRGALPGGALALLAALALVSCGGNDRVPTGPEAPEPPDPDPAPAPTPEIASIDPTSGQLGTVVTITGQNFSATAAENTVTFNGAEAQVTDASETELLAEVPAGAGTGPVAVSVGGETATGPDFTYVPTATVTTYAGAPEGGYVDGPAGDARFVLPRSVAIGADGTVYVADFGNCLVRKIEPGGEVDTHAGNASADPDPCGFEDGPGSFARFDRPSGVAVGAGGTVFVADNVNCAIREITPIGDEQFPEATSVTTLAGDGTCAFSDGNGRFASPLDVVAGPGGDVFVADAHGVRRVEPDGTVLTLAGGPTAGFEDGTGSGARLDRPGGVAVDAEGTVFVADVRNHAIREITGGSPPGEVTTLAGNGDEGFADNAGADARFSLPEGIAVDPNGVLYVADTDNHRIRRVTPPGEVSTVAGDGTPGLVDGTGGEARFRSPRDVAVDADGVLYVADSGNNVVRRITFE